MLLMIYQVWLNVFFYLFIVILILAIITTISLIKRTNNKSAEMKSMQQEHIAKIETLQREHSETLEKIRIEMLKREEERSRQWIESERETLHVLNGVSILLDLNEKIGKVESEKIMKKLDEIYEKLKRITSIT
jgi:hypothetical protein